MPFCIYGCEMVCCSLKFKSSTLFADEFSTQFNHMSTRTHTGWSYQEQRLTRMCHWCSTSDTVTPGQAACWALYSTSFITTLTLATTCLSWEMFGLKRCVYYNDCVCTSLLFRCWLFHYVLNSCGFGESTWHCGCLLHPVSYDMYLLIFACE